MTKPGAPQLGSKQACQFQASRRSVTRADNGDHRPCQVTSVALDVEKWRWRIERSQRRGVARLDREQWPSADFVGGLQFGFRDVTRAYPQGLATATLA